MDTKTMLLEFSNKAGLPDQQEAMDYGRELLKPYGTVTESPLGSLVCIVKEPQEGQPHILLDAHIDEIGLLVTFIDDDGFIRVGQFGGTDPRLLAASRVTVHTKDGKINGVIASIPPHLSGGQGTDADTADKVYIDLGMTKEEAEKTVFPGDRVTFHHAPVELLNGNVSAKALDDRSGCISLIKALEELDGDIPCGLSLQFSTMEEIGGMGAKTSAYDANPTHALAVDVSFAVTPDSPSKIKAELGSGPLVGFAPVLNYKISNSLVALAESHQIPYTREVMSGRTGTNADSIVTTRSGIKTALLSIPLRYMHMPIETVNIEDVNNTGKLLAAWIKSFGKDQM